MRGWPHTNNLSCRGLPTFPPRLAKLSFAARERRNCAGYAYPFWFCSLLRAKNFLPKDGKSPPLSPISISGYVREREGPLLDAEKKKREERGGSNFVRGGTLPSASAVEFTRCAS